MKAKELNTMGGELQGKIITAIVEMMNKHNVKLISFVLNGSYSDFDVERTFVLDVDDYGVAYESEVVAVYNNGRSVEILYDKPNISTETWTELEENIFVTDSELAEKIHKENDFISVDSLIAPTDTLLQLVYSVEEALETLKES